MRKSPSISRRLPPLVAMGTVIFIITPWMGNKPKFWICARRGEASGHTAAAGVEDEVHRDQPAPGGRDPRSWAWETGPFKPPGVFSVEALQLCQSPAWGLRGWTCAMALKRGGLPQAEDKSVVA